MNNNDDIHEGVNIRTDTENMDIKDKSVEMHQGHFSWFESSTPEEERVLNKIYEFEEKYFSDLTLKDHKTDLSEYRDNVIGEKETTYRDMIVSENVSFIDNNWRVILMNTFMYVQGNYGFCDGKKRLIFIAEDLIDCDSNLLHEMIHGYEFMLEPYQCYHQFVLIKLYQKLSLQIPNLNKIIKWDMHPKNTVYHSPLFLLKSLDLDIRLKQPFGTVYSYNREYYFTKSNPYAVKYKIFNKFKSKRFQTLYIYDRCATIKEAKKSIKNHQQNRLQNFNTEQEKVNNSRIKPFFKDMMYLPPIEYYIYKKDGKNKFTILIETISEKNIKIERYH